MTAQARPTGRSSIVAPVVLFASMIILAVLTTVVQFESQSLRRRIAEVNRAIDLNRRVEVALALEMSALHGLALTRNHRFLDSFERQRAVGEESLSALRNLSARFDAATANRITRLVELSRHWHQAVPRTDPVRDGPDRVPLLELADVEQELYNELIAEAAAIEQMFGDEAAQLARRIHAAQTLDWIATLVLTFLALSTAVVILWLGRRVDQLARESEERRAELERLIVARSKLMRGLSHDIRNPLSAVLGYTELLQQGLAGKVEARQKEVLANMHRAVGYALHMLDDLLELARSGTDRLNIEKELVDIVPLLKDAATDFRVQADRAGLELQSQLPDDPVLIMTDPARVRQILANLLSNAIKYTPSPGIVVLAASVQDRGIRSDAGPWLAIEVRDSGPGIAEAEREKVFEEFVRYVKNMEVKGLGLGLPMSRRVARLLGGDITVEQAPEKGAMFTLLLPLVPSDMTPTVAANDSTGRTSTGTTE